MSSTSDSVGKVIGAVLGALAVAVLAIGAVFAGVAVLKNLAPSNPACPQCGKPIAQNTTPCPHCGTELRWERRVA